MGGWKAGPGWGKEEEKRTYAEPEDDVAVGWVAGAAGELLVAGGSDDDGVVEGSCGAIPGLAAL